MAHDTYEFVRVATLQDGTVEVLPGADWRPLDWSRGLGTVGPDEAGQGAAQNLLAAGCDPEQAAALFAGFLRSAELQKTHERFVEIYADRALQEAMGGVN